MCLLHDILDESISAGTILEIYDDPDDLSDFYVGQALSIHEDFALFGVYDKLGATNGYLLMPKSEIVQVALNTPYTQHYAVPVTGFPLPPFGATGFDSLLEFSRDQGEYMDISDSRENHTIGRVTRYDEEWVRLDEVAYNVPAGQTLLRRETIRSIRFLAAEAHWLKKHHV